MSSLPKNAASPLHPPMVQDPFRFTVVPSGAGLRLDQYLAEQLPEHSRAYLAGLIRAGEITVNGRSAKPGQRIRPGDTVSGAIPPPRPVGIEPEAISLAILYEDEDLLVIDKPAGLVVHPAPGHPSGTLVNALLHHCPDLGPIGGDLRPGIVHRLDKDTSGVLLVAKNAKALTHLADQFKARAVDKTYLALVQGRLRETSGRVDLPIGRHPVDRKKMSTRSRRAREALSLWRMRERYRSACLIEVKLMTGRTHQIRVHCTAMGHPILGDRVYGGGSSGPGGTAPRQMLHSWRLGIRHPLREVPLSFEAPVPDDMGALIDILRLTALPEDRAVFSSEVRQLTPSP